MTIEDISNEDLAQALICCADDKSGSCHRCPVFDAVGVSFDCFNRLRIEAARRLRKAADHV